MFDVLTLDDGFHLWKLIEFCSTEKWLLGCSATTSNMHDFRGLIFSDYRSLFFSLLIFFLSLFFWFFSSPFFVLSLFSSIPPGIPIRYSFIEALGLLKGRCYSILYAWEYHSNDGTVHRLIQLRNPWRKREWTGKEKRKGNNPRE